jgi:hypothetical protein
MHKTYKVDEKMKQLIQNIIFGSILLGTIIVASIIVINALGPATVFQEECRSFGGTYFETKNVDCAVFHTYCASNCELNGQTLNYYDGDLCALDCKYHNEQDNEVRCVC